MSDRIRVLVVDDDPAARRIVAEELSESGPHSFDASYAGSMKEALKLLGERKFDAVLLDLGLPDTMGFEGLVRISVSTPALPVVVLTGIEDDALGLEALQKGATDYLAKGRVDAAQLARSLRYAIERKRSEEALRQLNESLERRVAERTEQLRATAVALTEAEQRERKRLAQVLHDELQQYIAAAKLRVGMLGASLADPRAAAQAGEISGLLQQAIDVSRTLSHEISPPILHEKGFLAALDWLAGWMRDKHNLTVEVRDDGSAVPEAPAVSVFLYEAVREMLFNVTKHACVERACVTVSNEGHRVRVSVEDEGSGFDPAGLGARKEGFGLVSIRDRARLFGGSLDIDSGPGRGSRFILSVPLRPAPSA